MWVEAPPPPLTRPLLFGSPGNPVPLVIHFPHDPGKIARDNSALCNTFSVCITFSSPDPSPATALADRQVGWYFTTPRLHVAWLLHKPWHSDALVTAFVRFCSDSFVRFVVTRLCMFDLRTLLFTVVDVVAGLDDRVCDLCIQERDFPQG